MNDEMKEILKSLQEDIESNTLIEVRGNYFKPLIKYITNLQQEKEDYKSRIEKAVKYIKENCITSDSWKDLDFCNFVPTGKITYKELNKSKIKELLNILNCKEGD